MGAVTVVKGAHDNEILLPTPWAGDFIDDEMAGMALVCAVVLGDIF
jgi:hypothetical protein